jgi:hypothetical protein
VRTALCDPELVDQFASYLSCHTQGDAGELGDEQTALNRAIMRRWRTFGRQNVDDTIRSEFMLEPGFSVVVLTCRHFTTIFAKDEYYEWSPESLLASMC